MFEEVVVGVGDGDTGRDAVTLGKELVSGRGRITLLHVHVVASKPAPDSGAVGDAAKRQYACERLQKLAGGRSVAAQVSCVDARSVRRGLHGFASSRHADLLVIGTSSPDEAAAVPLDDHTREVLENARCAVAVAPRGYAAGVVSISSIGVAYDGSPGSEQALALARRLATERQAELSAFEAVRPPLYVHDPWDVERETEEHVKAARQRLGALVGVKPQAGAGDAADELARYSDSVDLLVVGAHRYRPIDHLFDGSTAQQLVGRASAPLLVLPSGMSARGESR
ncbi:MAG TPA: universal stress protein [Gaiellales bacterium]|nr:universal stress protein [Gaiellales bacterium]